MGNLKKTKIRLRKNIFSIRYQFAFVTVIIVIIVSLIISSALLKKGEEETRENMVRFTSAILKGTVPDVRNYLLADDSVKNAYKNKDYSGADYYSDIRKKNLKAIMEYFPEIIKQEKILDIAFMINNNYNSTDLNWRKSSGNRYIYFKRNHPGIEFYTNKEPILNNIYDYYMSNMETVPNMVFGKNYEKPSSKDLDDSISKEIVSSNNSAETIGDFVLVGMPVFTDNQAEQLYSNYNEYRNTTLFDYESKKYYNQKKKGQDNELLKKLLANYEQVDYEFFINNKDINLLYKYYQELADNDALKNLNNDERQKLKDEFMSDISLFIVDQTLSYSLLIKKFREINQKYNIGFSSETGDDASFDKSAPLNLFEMLASSGITIKPLIDSNELFDRANKIQNEKSQIRILLRRGIIADYDIIIASNDLSFISDFVKKYYYNKSLSTENYDTVLLELNKELKKSISGGILRFTNIQNIIEKTVKNNSLTCRQWNQYNLWIKFLDDVNKKNIPVKAVMPYKELNKLAQEKDYENQFIKRLVYNDTEYNYFIRDAQLYESYIRAFFYKNYNMSSLKNEDYKLFENDMHAIISKSDTMYLSDIKDTYKQLSQKYQLSKKSSDDVIFWKDFFKYITYLNIPVSSKESLEDLAKYSYRTDLSGIIGIRFLRKEYYQGIDQNRREIVNLTISLALRIVLISLLIPVFIIRKIKILGDGAYEIGKGKYDQIIEIKSKDELGRLSDILNAMGKNLSKAQSEMLIKHRMEEELITARTIQETLLPTVFPEIPGLEFAAYYSAQTESGGDYYDVIKIDDERVAIITADVSGHGVGSGLVMAMTRTAIRVYSTVLEDIKVIVQDVNRHLYENTASNYFVTLFYGVINIKKKEMSFASCGHMPTILMRDGKYNEIPAGGIALGAVSNGIFDNMASKKKISLEKGDVIVQYSDGIVEAMNSKDEEYGYDRFKKVLLDNTGKSINVLKDAIIDDLNKFTEKKPQSDDITLLLVKLL